MSLLKLFKTFLLLGAIMAAVSAYMIVMPGKSYSGPFSPLTADEETIRDQLKHHVLNIASQPHHAQEHTQLLKSAEYIESVLTNLQYAVQSQPFMAAENRVRNIFVEIPGTEYKNEILIFGAHYDSVPQAPGANDNGSGTAAVLELARLLKGYQSKRTIRLMLFVNEELPYAKTDFMGSLIYANQAKENNEDIVGMFSIETIGYYSDQQNTQRYPVPFNYLYPNTGNFIGFVSNLPSHSLLHKSISAFRKHTQFPSEGLATPQFVPGIDRSDHWSFWKNGYPAVMITDTAPYRYPHYHTANDTPDKIDYDRTARVVMGIFGIVKELSSN